MRLLTFYCGHEDMLGTRYIFCSCWFSKKRNIRQLSFQCSFTNGVFYHHHSMPFKSLPRPSLPSTQLTSLPHFRYLTILEDMYAVSNTITVTSCVDMIPWVRPYSVTRRRNAALNVVLRSPKIELQWNLTFTVPPSGGLLFLRPKIWWRVRLMFITLTISLASKFLFYSPQTAWTFGHGSNFSNHFRLQVHSVLEKRGTVF